nr:MAG TPA: hypothetical protein [Microviridae sp.]
MQQKYRPDSNRQTHFCVTGGKCNQEGHFPPQ